MIYEGEEILFMYGKAYWDRWGADDEMKAPQGRRATRGAGGKDEVSEEQRAARGGNNGGGRGEVQNAETPAARAGSSAAHGQDGDGGEDGSDGQIIFNF